MTPIKRNAERMTERRRSYEAFTVILTLALFVSGEWISAVLVALFLVWVRDRVIRDHA
jgi:hypothetical protein